jgi:uncharacterized protein
MDNIDTILNYQANRAYPIPPKKWKYYQEWHDTVFFHWKVSPLLLENYIPDGLTLDIIDGTAWVSLVVFEVRKMRMRNLPSLPYINNFHEINLRTYVIRDGIPGIYMFSIETDKFIEVLMARWLIGLPYQLADMDITTEEVWSSNKNGQQLNFRFSGKSPIKVKTKLDVWLTERHCLFQDVNKRLYRFDIHHKDWLLRKLSAKLYYIKYKAGEFDLSVFPDKMHYCKKIRVLLWARQLHK